MIQIVAGTNRPGSNTRVVAGHLLSFYQQQGIPAGLLDLATLPPDMFQPASYGTKPAAFAAFSDAVLASGGLHIVTPEYNGGFPGVLKYFIDMLPFPAALLGKPVAFTGLAAGMWGAFRPVEQLEQIAVNLGAHVFPTRVFLPGIGKILAPDGSWAQPDAADRLQAQARDFAAFTARFKS